MREKSTYLIRVWYEVDNEFLTEVTIEEDKLVEYIESKLRPYIAKQYECEEEELRSFDYGWETVGLRDLENL